MSLVGRIRDRHAAATADEEWLTSMPDTPASPASPPPATPTSGGDAPVDRPLTAERVAAVRFQVAKPGYVFDQVEAFVEQTRDSLRVLEDGLYQRDVSLQAAREEIHDLEDRNATLQATVEVFRANGDPETTSDGEYVTEQQWEQMREERDQALQAVERLTAEALSLRTQLDTLPTQPPAPTQENPPDTSEVDELRAQVHALQSALSEAEAVNQELLNNHETAATPSEDTAAWQEQVAALTQERDEAIREVDELRHYIDTEITEWAASVAAAANTTTVTPDPAPDADMHPEPEFVDTMDTAPHDEDTNLDMPDRHNDVGTRTAPQQTPPSTLHNAPELS